jgi:hypothetical protein
MFFSLYCSQSGDEKADDDGGDVEEEVWLRGGGRWTSSMNWLLRGPGVGFQTRRSAAPAGWSGLRHSCRVGDQVYPADAE